MVLAHGIISDYLPESLSLGLRERLCLPALPLKVTKKPPSSGDQQQPPTKKTKLEGPVDDYVQSAAAPKTVKNMALRTCLTFFFLHLFKQKNSYEKSITVV